ncbi:MAG: histidine phosphatase family protein [Pseudomonas sp.]|uniref:histidine phosphatase family protein n=1 Tax=Pseudomonas abieticivorans TaxID=2931382 RepID=UPI0020BE08F3|nr:histidine phosphatase family protein [Pseudomonas sp. PIA16]MDE1166451.1 histidine phosphatase family protein [Pseudomonas sp.]
MQLYIARHGETAPNSEGRYVGSLNPALTERGIQQAQALRDQLPTAIDAIVVSPLLRARQTAEVLGQALQLPLHTLEHFRERNVGVFEGLTQAEAKARYPDLWAQNITRQWDAGPPQGESIAEVVARVALGLRELVATYPGQVVVLVAHGFVGKTIRALVRQDFSDFYEWQLANGQVLQLVLAEPWVADAPGRP